MEDALEGALALGGEGCVSVDRRERRGRCGEEARGTVLRVEPSGLKWVGMPKEGMDGQGKSFQMRYKVEHKDDCKRSASRFEEKEI